MTNTTTRAGALAELIAKVEAGEDAGVKKASSAIASSARDAGQYWPHHDILKAYFHGSLDAAKALHEAVLPGWDWAIGCGGASVYDQADQTPYDGECDDNPARAWLLAILRALEQQEGAKG